MYQNILKEDEISIPRITISNDQLIESPDSHILPQEKKNSIKKVMSLNNNEIDIKNKNKIDHKAFNVKLTMYKNMQKNFLKAFDNLAKSYANLEKHKMDSLNNIELEEFDTIVKNMIEKQFGIKFSNTTLKQNHELFDSNINMPLNLNINSTSGNQKLNQAIKETFEDVWKNILDVSKINMEYNFWLTNIIKPNEFGSLYDVKQYLVQNMCNNEQTIEQLQLKLKQFYNDLQLKLINIFDVVDEIFKCDKNTSVNLNNVIKEKMEDECIHFESNTISQNIINNYKHKMEIKINMLELENEKLKVNESECSRQIQSLLGELAFRNRKLTNTKDRLALLMKEKNDLICTIEKLEVKGEGIHTLQNKFEKEREKNNNLRAIIEKQYENIVDFNYEHNL